MLPALLLAAALPAAKPAGDPRRWFTTADYPVDALLEQQQGVVGFELAVDAAGKPVACHIYRSAGKPLLEEATCKLALERARFAPAFRTKKVRRKRRERGQVIVRRIGPAVPSVFRHAVRWRLPNKDGISDQTFVVRSTVAGDGSVAACAITGPGALGGSSSCGLFGSRAFLSGMLAKDWARTRVTEVRLDLVRAADAGVRPVAPDAYWLLAEASVTFDGSGRLVDCIGLKALRSATKSTDLCQLLKAQPPKIAAGAGSRRAVYMLDLSGYFR